MTSKLGEAGAARQTTDHAVDVDPAFGMSNQNQARDAGQVVIQHGAHPGQRRIALVTSVETTVQEMSGGTNRHAARLDAHDFGFTSGSMAAAS